MRTVKKNGTTRGTKAEENYLVGVASWATAILRLRNAKARSYSKVSVPIILQAKLMSWCRRFKICKLANIEAQLENK